MKSDTAIKHETRGYEHEIFTERKSLLTDRGGYVGAIFKRNLKCKMLKLGKYATFGLMVLQIMSDAGKYSSLIYTTQDSMTSVNISTAVQHVTI